MEEDWGVNANAPSFSLFDTGPATSPEEQAKLETFVNPIIYHRWSKADRKLYQRLKAQKIADKLANDEIKTLDDITAALDSLSFLKSNSIEPEHDLDRLMKKIESLKL